MARSRRRPSTGNRTWTQISLRTFLCGVALLCIALGMLLNRAREQQRSVEAIERVHGLVLYDFHRTADGSFDDSRASDMSNWAASGIGFHLVHRVVLVDLDSPLVTDATLDLLAGCPEVEQLSISDTSITDDGLAALEALTRLRAVYINTRGITNDSLRHLSRVQGLETVTIENSDIDDDGLVHLQSARKLRRLSLYRGRVTEQGIARLRELLPDCDMDHGNW
jgi:hypothetical protein